MLATKLRAATAGQVAWDVSYAYYDPPAGLAGNISTAGYLRLYDVGVEETSPQSVFFKPDGTKMYVLGGTGDDVNEYDLSIAWDIGSSSYLQNFSVAAQDTSPVGLFFKPDGTKMYVLGDAGNAVSEYDLSTAWDISTASHLQDFSVGAQELNPTGLFFKPDGTKMYVVGRTQGDDVNEYALSTAWDISTASYLGDFFLGNQDSVPRGVFFKPDGKQMFMIGSGTDSVYAYTIGIQP